MHNSQKRIILVLRTNLHGIDTTDRPARICILIFFEPGILVASKVNDTREGREGGGR